MSKVLGYTQKGGQHWFGSTPYGNNEINAIKDPQGGAQLFSPTAIPSPFARMDLTKTAFRNISNTPRLRSHSVHGNTIAGKSDEKLVSDTLDIAEILFNIDALRNKLKIVVWDKQAELTNLKNGPDEHRRLAETLEMYLSQDARAYNFDRVNRLYVFVYEHEIIGGTSPSTLFYPSGGDLSRSQIRLTGNDIMFDQNYTPLYQRDEDFQEYLYSFFEAHATLASKLGVFKEYLDKNLQILSNENPSLFNRIKNLEAKDHALKYDDLSAGNAGNVVEVLGATLGKKKNIVSAVVNSDFVINSPKYKSALKPLVLQNDFSKPFRYASDRWVSTFKVPFFDKENNLQNRRLPELGISYPYLTVSDFLEPYLIQTVFPINHEAFFTGDSGITKDSSTGFLLPLKPRFFDYFDTDDLLSGLPNKPSIEMMHLPAGAVKVSLKVPIKRDGEFITLERIYYKSGEGRLAKPDEENNKGTIIQHQFGVTIFPFLRTGRPEVDSFYRIQLIDRDVAGMLKDNQYSLKFFINQQPDPTEIQVKRERRKKDVATLVAGSQYYALEQPFDLLQVQTSVPHARGMIIPRWKNVPAGNETFSFAVDFGTTNTHIEFKIGNGNPKPFTISEKDIQIATLFHPKDSIDSLNREGAIAIQELVDHEFVPLILGADSEYEFPHRTTLAANPFLDINMQTFTLTDFNIPFIYERKPHKEEILTNLKWAKREAGNEKRLNAYFEQIAILMRNKVLLNNGDLSKTKLVWFYPSSMTPGRISSLKNVWNELFKRYFHTTSSSVGIAESLAPFYYYRASGKIQGGAYQPVVSIDIGGGTSDVVVFQNDQPKLLTSFKFAANSIFGNGFSEYVDHQTSDGIVKKYLPHYVKLLETNKLPDLTSVLNSIKEKNTAEDINTFFFSLEKNKKIKDPRSFSFNKLLSADDDLKIVFLYFYAAIIYHIAHLMKLKKIDFPKHILFSGTGSKILDIITDERPKQILSDFSSLIFKRVYGESLDSSRLTVETEDGKPKEITCKGALMTDAEKLTINVSTIEAVLTCVNGADKMYYHSITDEIKADIVHCVQTFNEFFVGLNGDFNFYDYFNVSRNSFDIFRNECNEHHRDFLEFGLSYNSKLDDFIGDDQEIEETLFFYPIVGTIHHLLPKLSRLTPINN